MYAVCVQVNEATSSNEKRSRRAPLKVKTFLLSLQVHQWPLVNKTSVIEEANVPLSQVSALSHLSFNCKQIESFCRDTITTALAETRTYQY